VCVFYHNFGWSQAHNAYESFALAVILFMGWIFFKWTYSEARATLEAKTLARSEATVHRLLSAMCDAVVHLGSDCRILHPCPKLEVLLLKSRTHSGLQGTPFMDLLDSSERDRFDHFLSSVTNEPSGHDVVDPEDMACTLHLHMRDATGTKVPVQIFHGSCLDINEQICHLVGIREDQETASRREATELNTFVDGGLSPLLEHCAMPVREAASDCSSVSAVEPAAEVAVVGHH
jgi:hypothetical protein